MRLDHLGDDLVDDDALDFNLLVTQIDFTLVEQFVDLLVYSNVPQLDDAPFDVDFFLYQRNREL
jgi:hypothetical protein